MSQWNINKNFYVSDHFQFVSMWSWSRHPWPLTLQPVKVRSASISTESLVIRERGGWVESHHGNRERRHLLLWNPSVSVLLQRSNFSLRVKVLWCNPYSNFNSYKGIVNVYCMYTCILYERNCYSVLLSNTQLNDVLDFWFVKDTTKSALFTFIDRINEFWHSFLCFICKYCSP